MPPIYKPLKTPSERFKSLVRKSTSVNQFKRRQRPFRGAQGPSRPSRLPASRSASPPSALPAPFILFIFSFFSIRYIFYLSA